MDANKLKKLKSLPYKINRVCGLCKHGAFVHNSMWGGCSKHSYDHLKHTAPAKPLSIHLFGSCPGFELDPLSWTLDTLAGFKDFVEE